MVVALDSQHKSQVTSHNMERGKVWFRMQKKGYDINTKVGECE